jgi:hypothetical protein
LSLERSSFVIVVHKRLELSFEVGRARSELCAWTWLSHFYCTIRNFLLVCHDFTIRMK